ncbi:MULTISPECIES: hypothetical protein [Sorangium]|uniref:Uncharacterized protein n=1 Tax=Sorangium cellulosum TaxID=56 RepID=A0A4P2R621_SORCE|nr:MULTISPECIES: hypothetical protein [Sorangium]AUX38597.1 uncharacterized protein SOCE836_108440 [Sorangium cellulosum]WCQ97882.1 hypothetical protein NQZ70_10680 [Sorangium sp. Soce836]
MFGQFTLKGEFFATLEALDRAIARRVAASRCPACGGPLHAGNYPRKPRGALIAPEGEVFLIRFSFCCGREGWRRRATPPSLRFLGPRVYLGVVVIVASLAAQALGAGGAQPTGVPRRTTRRWLAWWRGPFLAKEVLLAIRARLVGVDVGGIPRSIIEQLPGTPDEQMGTMLHLLAPLTTGSVLDGSRFLRDIA